MSYARLAERFEEISHLDHAHAMIEWDQATMMPAGGGEARAGAIGALEEIRHALSTAPEVEAWIQAASEETLEPWAAANLREIQREHRRNTLLPTKLVGARARARSRGHGIWQAARPANDWAAFAPALEEILALEREAASILAESLGTSRYEALLDGYEAGGTLAQVEALFAELREFLIPFIPRAAAHSRARWGVDLEGPFDVEAQRQLGEALMRDVGFDFARGRLDASAHPFCGGVPSDVRITTRYDEADFASALMGVLHETGHAKYEQGLPSDWTAQPVGRARSMSWHESQSLLQEMQISRSRAFLVHAAPRMREAFPARAAAQPQAFSLENLAQVYTRVQPSKIRVDADEVTYPCHVMLRTSIEVDLVEGRMEVAQLPERWDAEMQTLLGIDTRGDYKDGCMQDIHWAVGAFGYFPTYTLGAMRAAQLFAALRRDLPEVDDAIARGEFDGVDSWLRERVWSQASLLEGEALMEAASGAPLSCEAFIAHLETRYGDAK